MADTVTSNYDFIKPEPGASNETWGIKLNANWDAVDGLLKTLFDSVTLFNSGAMVAMFATTAIPSGWVPCHGQAISRAVYTDLYSRIGTVFGSGDGVSTFNVPDFRGVFPRGWDNRALGQGHDGGRAFGSYQADEFKSHTHTGSTSSAGNHSHTITVNSGGAHTHTGSAASAGAHTHSGSAASAGSHSHTGSAASAGAHTHTIPSNTPGSGSVAGFEFTNVNHQSTTDGSTYSAGAHTHSLSINAAGEHTHSLSINSGGAHTHTLSIDSGGAHTHTASSNTTGAHSHDVVINATGGSETRPKNIALQFCIYTGVAE